MKRSQILLGALAAALLAAGAARADTYTYDALGRLVTVVSASGGTRTYTYDAAGNRTAITVT
jgi:YD repeat-containing protein